MKCSDCKFFYDFEENKVEEELDEEELDEEELMEYGEGECRKNPPTLLAGDVVGSFPNVFKVYWCGAFEKKQAGCGAECSLP